MFPHAVMKNANILLVPHTCHLFLNEMYEPCNALETRYVSECREGGQNMENIGRPNQVMQLFFSRQRVSS